MRPTLLLALTSLLTTVPASGAAVAGTPTVVTLKTADGLSLEADWYRGEVGMPGVVALHMYRSDRSAWRPLADALPAGWHFLAVDLRGHGGSAKQGKEDLAPKVEARDADLFKAMWQDAAAGLAFLAKEGNADPDRIGVIGASMGCSVAFDAVVRGRGAAAVAVLSPGTNYLGIPTMEQIRAWPGVPVLLVAPKVEEEPVEEIAGALSRHPWIEKRIVPGGKDLHGTRMFGQVEGIETFLVRWLEAALGRAILDGEVDPFEATDPGAGRGGALDLAGADPGRLHLRADGKALSLSFQGKAELMPTFAVTVTVPPASGEGPPDIQRFRGAASASGTPAGAWMDSWSGTAWVETSVTRRPDTAVVKGRVLEVRLPWGTFGVRPGRTVRVEFAMVRSKSDWQVPPASSVAGAEAGIEVEVPELEVGR